MAARPRPAAAPEQGRKAIKVTLVRSTIGFDRRQGKVVRSLGLRRIRHTVELLDTPETRGMIRKVRHLVRVEERD